MVSRQYINDLVSIIIIVKNDRKVLDTINHIYKCKTKFRYEIIVIDASDGKLSDIEKDLKNVRWVNFPSVKNKVTIPEQRNLGICLSHGEIIVFIDANCIPHKDWLQNLSMPLMEKKEMIVCGSVKSQGTKTFHDTVDTSMSDAYVDECASINLAIHHTVFNKVGVFDPYFEYGSDLDFSWRLVRNGYRILFRNNAVVTHDFGSIKDELRRSFYYGKAKGRLYKKHRDKINKLLTSDWYILAYSFFILLLPVALYYPVYLLVLLIPMMKNLNNQPFLLVQYHLIYSFGFLVEIFDFRKSTSAL